MGTPLVEVDGLTDAAHLVDLTVLAGDGVVMDAFEATGVGTPLATEAPPDTGDTASDSGNDTAVDSGHDSAVDSGDDTGGAQDGRGCCGSGKGEGAAFALGVVPLLWARRRRGAGGATTAGAPRRR